MVRRKKSALPGWTHPGPVDRRSDRGRSAGGRARLGPLRLGRSAPALGTRLPGRTLGSSSSLRSELGGSSRSLCREWRNTAPRSPRSCLARRHRSARQVTGCGSAHPFRAARSRSRRSHHRGSRVGLSGRPRADRGLDRDEREVDHDGLGRSHAGGGRVQRRRRREHRPGLLRRCTWPIPIPSS